MFLSRLSPMYVKLSEKKTVDIDTTDQIWMTY